jgi:hypothetical protein
MDTVHPATSLTQVMTSMTTQSTPVAPDPAAAHTPDTPSPALTETKHFSKWILKVRALFHVKRRSRINHQVAETPSFADLSSDLYVMLINCLDRDMLESYLQAGPV